MQTNYKLPPIWDHFKATKDVDAHRMQWVEEMTAWAKEYDKQINRGLYFDKATMNDIVKLEFCPGTPTAYLNTAKQGMPLLICCSQQETETSNIRSKKQALRLTAQNHTLTESLLFGKHNPRLPVMNYDEFKQHIKS